MSATAALSKVLLGTQDPASELARYHGHRLKVRRVDECLTQADLAERVGVTQQTISDWENGRAPISDRYKLTLAQTLDSDPSALFPLTTGPR